MAEKPVPIKLLKPHTDRGAEHPPGAVINLRPDQAARLIAEGIGAAVNPPPPAPSPEPEPKPGAKSPKKEDDK